MKNAVPISEAIKTDPNVAEIVSQIESGEIHLGSPIEPVEWSVDDIARLESALKVVFGQ
jgi:hypothetical protein